MIKYLRSHGLLTLFFLSCLIFIFLNIQVSNAQNNTSTSDENAVRTATVLKRSYELADAGFNITFPKGWDGLNYGIIAMVSPDGINEFNGNLKRNEDNILMVIEVLNISDYQKNKDIIQVQKGCQIMSENISAVNVVQSKEVYINCGPGGDQKIINYIFSSAKKIFIVGLKGTGHSFENNLDEFRKSVKTVIIQNPVNAE